MQAQFKPGTNSRLKNSHQIQANAHLNFEAEFCRALVSLCNTVLCCAFLSLCYVLFNLMPVYMVSNKSSYSHKKGLSADANRPTNNYMKVISFCNWWAATSQPLRQKSVCSAHYANYFKEKFVKKRGEQFSLSENSFIEMIHSKKCEK